MRNERALNMAPQAGLTRRSMAAGLAGLVALGVCTADAGQATPAACGTRPVDTIHGVVEVPADPRRVVALT